MFISTLAKGKELMEGKLRSVDGKELFSPFGDEGVGIWRG